MPGFGRSYKAKKTSGKKKTMRGKKKPAARSAVKKGKKKYGR